jgi:ABC-2 type transport system ATP-binding protein
MRKLRTGVNMSGGPASCAAPAIEVRDLTKLYPVPRPLWRLLLTERERGAVQALDRVSFTVAPGEVLGLLGPNGAGKTTLINILCTLLTPTSGKVQVGGHDVRTAPHLVRKLIGLVTSNERSFYWRLTGRQNLQFFAELYRVPVDKIGRRVDRFLLALNLAEHADRRFDRYSTGIRQRFAIARALLHEPTILFMDEPTKGLDPNASTALLALIRERILPEWTPTIIVTSHNLAEIEALCDRVAIIDHGKLLRIGTIGDLAHSIRSHETYAVQISGVGPGIVTGLAELLGPDCVRVAEGEILTLELGLGDGERSLSTALRYILDQGGVIRQCEPVEISLAEIFRQMIPMDHAA